MGGGFFQPASEVTQRFLNGISVIFGALIIFIAGLIAAKFIKLLLTRFFRILNIDKVSEDSGLTTMLEKGNISKDVSELLGMAVYWIVMLVVIFMSMDFAGVSIPQTVIDGLIGFIPKFILGLLIFIFSLFLGTFFGGIVRTAAGNTWIKRADALGRVTHSAIVVFGTVLALQHIGIAAEFIGNVFIILLTAFAFGSALAFALGAKDIVKKYLEDFIEKEKSDAVKKQ